MIRISFPISSKCSGCRYLKLDENDWRFGGKDGVLKCNSLAHCSFNEDRNRAFGFKEVRDETKD